MKVWNNMKAGKLFFFLFRPTISWMHTAVMTEDTLCDNSPFTGIIRPNCYASLEKARNREALKVSDRNSPLLDA